MDSGFSELKRKARDFDKKMDSLELKLAFPGSFYRITKAPHAERIMEEIISKNDDILENIVKEKTVAENNIHEMDIFLKSSDACANTMINELQCMEEQMKQYGYVPMPDSSLDKSLLSCNGDNADECNGKEENNLSSIGDRYTESNMTTTEEQVFKFPVTGDTKTECRRQNQTTNQCKFSKYYYEALGLPIPIEISKKN